MSSSEEPSRDVPGDSSAPESAALGSGWVEPHPEHRVEPWPGTGGHGYPPLPEGLSALSGIPVAPTGYPHPGYSQFDHSGSAEHSAQQFGPDGYGPLAPGANHTRRSHGGWVVAAAVAVAAGALTGLLATPVANLPSLTGPAPTRPSARVSATPTPKPADVLKKNSSYTLKVTGACPSQRIPSSWKVFQAQVRALVECENKAWSTALRKVSVQFSKPRITFYTKTADSPCGHLDSMFPASYCSGNETLYFSRASYQQGRYYRLSVSEFVFHEYAHHVQSLTGIFEASVSLTEAEDVTERRIELQAHCIAHYRLTHAGLKFSSDDREDVEYQLGYSADAKGHGSAKAGRYWGEAGLNGKRIGACNTWKAKASLVK